MQFTINYKGKEVEVNITSWESTMNNRVEFYAVFVGQQETFVNYVKRTDQLIITEEAASADLTEDIKAIIKDKLIHFAQHAHK